MIVNKNKKVVSKEAKLVVVLFFYVVLLFTFGGGVAKLCSVVILGLIIIKNRYEILPLIGVRRRKISEQQDTEIAEDEKWFDDYFTLKYIDEKTIAIGEPRYWQRNYSYLILGEERAILFDAGTGYRDISTVVKELTDLPVVVMISHYHFDHIGNINKFDTIYLSENQVKRQVVLEGNRIIPHKSSHLGILEGLKGKEFRFEEIFGNKEIVDLGARKLQVLYAPGHDVESIVLYDQDSNMLFAGDYLMKGPILAHKFLMPTASLVDYKFSAQNIVGSIENDTRVYLAHPIDLSDQTLTGQDISDLNNFISTVEKNNFLPKKKTINQNIYIMY
ncbi:MAG: hypothetical protein ATN31_07455 [Candidatus Epulonipiscioides saccharophilum]|nr:MAG: hypothetical protein ATN31_07455 [Epulopiscium sp. AS2M-Bin001]